MPLYLALVSSDSDTVSNFYIREDVEKLEEVQRRAVRISKELLILIYSYGKRLEELSLFNVLEVKA